MRLAASSPLLLLDTPGWHVTRADETDRVEGEMTFTPGSAPFDPTSVADARRSATLNWRRGPLEQWQRDRANSASRVVRRTVLGQPAQVSQYTGSTDFAAIWPDGGRVLEFRAVAADLEAFERLVGSLRRVDVDTWLSALPASVVKAASRPDVIGEMLADIPLPPGFDSSRLARLTTISDRYQLGARVTGSVACGWLARRAAARRSGDAKQLAEAVTAMQSSRRWKILVEMDRGGGWPSFVWELADALRDGKRHWPAKAPIERAIGGGPGCAGS